MLDHLGMNEKLEHFNNEETMSYKARVQLDLKSLPNRPELEAVTQIIEGIYPVEFCDKITKKDANIKITGTLEKFWIIVDELREKEIFAQNLIRDGFGSAAKASSDGGIGKRG